MHTEYILSDISRNVSLLYLVFTLEFHQNMYFILFSYECLSCI